MPLPMVTRFLVLGLGSLLSVAALAQVPAPAPVPTPSVTVRVSVTQLDPKTGRTDILSAPAVTVLSGSEARVAVSGRPDPKGGKVENALEVTMSPTAQPDGTMSIGVRVLINKPADPDAAKAEKQQQRREAKSHDGSLVFYSVLSRDGLYSVQDGRGNRRWFKLGAIVDGWKLESYDEEKQMLIVGQGATRQELRLYKSSIEASANEISTTVNLRSGETVRVPGIGGTELSVSAVLVPGAVAPPR